MNSSLPKFAAVTGLPGLLTAGVVVGVGVLVSMALVDVLFLAGIGTLLAGLFLLTSSGSELETSTDGPGLPSSARDHWVDGAGEQPVPVLAALGFYCLGIALGVSVVFVALVAL